VEECAALPLTGQTVLQAFERAGITPTSAQGKRILIHAGAGGVGTIAIQVAKLWGLKTFTTCSHRNISFCRDELGADVVIDYNEQRFEDTAKDMDYVFDVMGGNYEIRSMNCVKASGTYINIMNSGWATKIASGKEHPDGVTGANSTIGSMAGFAYSGYRLLMQYITGPYYKFCVIQPRASTLKLLKELCDDNGLRPIIDSQFPLEKTTEAHNRIKTGRTRGKIIISLDSPTKSNL